MEETRRIVLLGKTGAGKSSLANTIFGENGIFKQNASPNSGTKECCAKTRTVYGRSICLIDTPGLFDTELKSTELSDEILTCIKECAPGPHAFLIVLKIEKFTGQEQGVVDIILNYFSEEALKYTSVVFTRGDDLPEEMKIKDWAFQNKALKTLIDRCGGRVNVFDNKYWNNSYHSYRNNQVQVQELLNSIDQKNGKYYTNKYLEFVINSLEKIRFGVKYAARVLLGALVGNKDLGSVLIKGSPPVKRSANDATRDSSLYQQEVHTLRIVLLGKCGSGKSSLANTIFGERDFMVSHSASSRPYFPHSHMRHVHGRIIQLIDTPGIFDTDRHSSELMPGILSCIVQSAPGPHAFLLVLKLERFTRHEQEVVNMIIKYFSAEALKYTTVVFTNGDLLPEGMRVEDWVYENEALYNLVQKCGGRVHVFDNKYWNNSNDPYRNNQVQVKELLNTIEQTVIQNGGKYYSNEMLQDVQQQIDKELEQIRQQQHQQQQQQQPKSFFRSFFGF